MKSNHFRMAIFHKILDEGVTMLSDEKITYTINERGYLYVTCSTLGDYVFAPGKWDYIQCRKPSES